MWGVGIGAVILVLCVILLYPFAWIRVEIILWSYWFYMEKEKQ